MSEYFTGVPSSPDGPPLPGEEQVDQQATAHPAWLDGPEPVRFGVPFNGVVPIWHEGTQITWHRPLDGTDLAEVLGLGHVATQAGPSPVPPSWREEVETGVLVCPDLPDSSSPADPPAHSDAGSPPISEVGPVLVLHPAAPSGRHAEATAGEGARIPLSPALSIQEAMGSTAADFDITGFSVHVGRLMLRAAAEGAILLFTLRAPKDPQAHHLLSVPASVDTDHVMHFHLGTLLEIDTGAWAGAQHADGMALLDLDVPYTSLLATSPSAAAGSGADAAGLARPEVASEALSIEAVIDMAQPVIDAILAPGFPFALGASFIVPAA